jgi:hypothetical protein
VEHGIAGLEGHPASGPGPGAARGGARLRRLAAVAAVAALLSACADDEAGDDTDTGSGDAVGEGVDDAPLDELGAGDAGADPGGDAGAEADASPEDDAGAEGGDGAPADLPAGHWLWVREVEAGGVVLEVTDADMVARVGPSGWEGCPEDTICTRYGIRKVRFDGDGAVRWIHNVVTSSDFEYFGAAAARGDLVEFRFDDHFSCAHPDVRDGDLRVRYARFRLQDGDLWLSVATFDSDLPFADSEPVDPQRWIVFRPVTPEEFDDRFTIRLCQAPSDSDCHPACFPERW